MSPPLPRLASTGQPPPMPRHYGRFNWLGLWTLYLREVRRFFKVGVQTVAAPVVTQLLLLAVFALSLGGSMRQMGGVPFAEFLAPGLIMMAMAQNAFANTSSSLVISKIQGNIVDSLMPPLSAGELTWGFALGGVTRGVVVGVAMALAILPFAPVHIHDPGLIIFHGLAASLMLSTLGLLAGLWSEKFDHIAAVTNFIVTPLTFLSGTFYTVENLPDPWHLLAHLNPFFYMIDGFRYGFIGHADSSLSLGVGVLVGTNLALLVLCHILIRRGYRLRV
jgi:ABC-2 type transport system permease protein